MKIVRVRLAFLFLVSLALTSCADKKDSAQSCAVQLDEQKYSTVAANTNCSDYERSSAYLGQAGVSFANFLKDGAGDNYVATLGIETLSSATDYEGATTTKKNRKYITKALCLAGSDNLTSSSRCTDHDKRSSSTRSNAEIEISFFALIADLIHIMYGTMDTDLNGTISSSENSAFTGVSSSGTTSISSTGNYQLIYSDGTSRVGDSTLANCSDTTTDFGGVSPSGGKSCTSNLTEIRPIAKMDGLIDLFSTKTAGELTPTDYGPTNFLTAFSLLATYLDSDLSALGISSTNSLRTDLKSGVNTLDNGAVAKDNATCKAVAPFDLLNTIAVNAAVSSSEVATKNLLSTTDMAKVSSTLTLGSLPDGISGVALDEFRLVYKNGSSYTDTPLTASDMKTALEKIRSLTDNSSISSTAKDGTVDFRELLCVAEN